MSASIPRFLLPRGRYLLLQQQRQQLQQLHRPLSSAIYTTATTTLARHASSSSSSSSNKPVKPLVLEKPARFNPPSHPARMPRKPRSYPGPRLSEVEKKEQQTKQYPNMMPAEGTFMHWFLTNRGIHMWISLSILFSLAFYAFMTNFLHTTPYVDMLPERSLFFYHPLQYISQYLEVYKLHSAWLSGQTAERRKKKVDDAQKRAEYRKAHGMENSSDGIASWFGKADESESGAEVSSTTTTATMASSPSSAGDIQGAETIAVANQEGTEQEAVKRKRVKKWFGIWE